jgi:hypothetical protein
MGIRTVKDWLEEDKNMKWEDSADNEYHLTPKGWVPGTEYIYGETDQIIDRPSDTIETWVRRLQQATGRSPERVGWERIWVLPRCSEFETTGIKRRFPSPV